MAEILIRGMEMPTKCWTCWMKHGCFAFPSVLYDKSIEYEERIKKKSDDCPLVELPEHGDLIDRGKLSFVCGGTAPMGMDYVRRYVVDGMPVIIPSNKEETK